jgi:hypothetical protein
MKEAGEGARAVLRFYDLARMGSWFDIEIDPEATNWYVHLWTPGRPYSAELGFRGTENQFVRVLESNIVQLPRAWPVVSVEERFAYVEPAKPLSPQEVQEAQEAVPPSMETGPPVARRFGATTAPTSLSLLSLPKPVDSTERLQKKLTEMHYLGESGPELPPGVAKGVAKEVVRVEAPRASATQLQAETGLDLTAEAEKAFINLPSSSQ